MAQQSVSQFRKKTDYKTQICCIFLGYCIFLTTFALVKVLGIFFIHFQSEFQASASQVSLTVGLTSAVVFIGGPAYGAIFNSLGIKPTFTLAGLLMFCGFGGCFFTPTLFYTQLSIGLVAGMGAGLSNVATLTLTGRAFYTSRPIAAGALSMGESTAVALGGILIQKSIDAYTWRGAMLLVGVYCLHGIAFGFAIVPTYNKIIKDRERALLARTMSDKKMENNRCDSKEPAPKQAAATDKEEQTYVTNHAATDVLIDNSIAIVLNNGAEESRPTKEQRALYRRKSSYRRRQSVYERMGALSSTFASVFDLTLLKDPLFVCFCVSCGFSISSRLISGLYLVRYAQSRGLEDHEATKKLSICEMSSFIVVPIIAMLTSIKRKPSYQRSKCVERVLQAVTFVKRSYLLAVFQLFMAFALFLPTLTENNEVFTVYAALLGLCLGAVTPLTNVVLADMFGTKRLACALGYRSLASGILILSLPPFIGHLIDLNGNYAVAQYSTSLLSFLSGVLTLLSQVVLMQRNKKDSQNNNR